MHASVHKQLVSEKEDMFAHLGTLQSNVKQLEAKVLESEKAKNTVEKEFEALKLFKEQVSKDAQKTTLMDMEIADYERLVKELNQKITDRDNRIVEVIDEMTSCKQKLETMDCEI
eukprot:g47416.t1